MTWEFVDSEHKVELVKVSFQTAYFLLSHLESKYLNFIRNDLLYVVYGDKLMSFIEILNTRFFSFCVG